MGLINRDKAAFELCRIICGSDRDLCVSHPKNCCRQEMKNFYKITTVDAQPVVHAHWIDDMTCSNCHNFSEDDYGHIVQSFYDYCPFCGSKMDEKV